MNVKKLFVNTLLMGAVATAPVGLSSCDDDDGGGGGNGPGIGENSARLILSDGATDTISAAANPQYLDSAGSLGGGIGGSQTFSGFQVTWADGSGNTVSVSVTKSSSGGVSGTGTFSPFVLEDLTGGNIPDQFANVNATYGGSSWSPANGNGNVEITTNNNNKVVGTINNITLSKFSPTDSTTVTVNGAFDVSK